MSPDATGEPSVVVDTPAGGPVSPPTVADGVDHVLDPRVIALHRTVGAIFAACVAAGSLIPASVLWRATDVPWVVLLGAWAAISSAVAWHSHRWPRIEYEHAAYRVDDEGIQIRRGVYWRTVTNVPRTRVQHTDVSQGPIERRHGLATLVIYTAGTDHAKVTLAGLDHARALRIRDHLLPGEARDAV